MDNESQFIQSESCYRRRTKLIVGMMVFCLVVAFVFSIWARSYHVALFWWVDGAAGAGFLALAIISAKQKNMRKRQQANL